MEIGADAARAQRVRENELLLAVAKGDVDALRRLYRAFERPLYSLGRRWLGDEDLAEELVQEVTLRMWRRAAAFDPARGAASSWVFGIARNVAADLARAKRRKPVPVGEVIHDPQPWDEDAVWTGWQVASALRSLPDEQQEVLRLAYVEDLTQSEIAAHLRIPLGTVKTRTYTGLRRLRGVLIDMGVIGGEAG